MDKRLTDKIWRLREEYKVKRYEHPVNLIYASNGTYQLYFATVGCSRACSMCIYGYCEYFDEQEAIAELEELVFPEDINILVLEASGSFLDEREISKTLRRKVFDKILQIKTLKYIDIETHYTTITDEILEEISSISKYYKVEIGFEFGIESVNQDVLKLYNKDIDFERLLDVIYKAYKYNISCDLNFLVGAPTLTINEQIEDTISSIYWMIKNCPNETVAVLFPINIKSFTLIGELYKIGKYKLIYSWEFIEVLDRIPKEYLNRITIAWWGNRVNLYDGKEEIKHPYSCGECHEKLQKFYEKFYMEREVCKRKKLLEDIKKIHCECRETFIKEFSKERNSKIKIPSISMRFEEMKQWIK